MKALLCCIYIFFLIAGGIEYIYASWSGWINEAPDIVTSSLSAPSGTTTIGNIIANDEDNIILEYWNNTLTGNIWESITHSEMCNPVVVASHRQNVNGEIQRAARVRNKSSSVFEIQVDNYNSSIGSINTQVDYVVAESGSYDLWSGLQFEARSHLTTAVACNASKNTLREALNFINPFASAPAVLHSVSSENDASWTVSSINAGNTQRQSEPTTTSIWLILQRSFNNCSHAPEQIDFLAINPGHYTIGWNEFDAVRSSDSIRSITTSGNPINFNSPFSSIPQTLLVSQMGEDGWNGWYAQVHTGGSPSTTSFPATIDEDGPAADRNHTREVAGGLAFANANGSLRQANTLSYSIVWGVDAWHFSLSTTGSLSFLSAKTFTSPDDANADGVYQLQVQVCDSHCNSKCSTENISVSLIETPPLNFEIPGWYTVSEGSWNRQTTTVQEGTYALQADNAWSHNSNSCFQREETISIWDSYSFWYKVSSESGYDFLRFYDNGTEITNWSWEAGWSEYIHSPSVGSHVFRWCYTKDINTSNGSDTAWIDDGKIIPSDFPGGIGENLALWFKSNKWTSTSIDGASLNTWNDQSGNNNNATAGVAPIFRNSVADQLNFYPSIDFNGTSQYLQNLNNQADTRSYYMVIIPDKDIEGTSSEGVPFGFNCESGTLSSGTCGIPFAGLALWAFTVAIPDEVLTHAIGSSTNWRSAKTATVSYPADRPILISVNENITNNGTDIYKEWEQINNYSTNTYQYVSGADFNIGKAPDPTYPFYYDGKITEIINYASRLDNNSRQKIESYLAYKYGITLNNGNSNYISSDGSTLMWSSSLWWAYKYDIFWIGYDKKQALIQTQSKSINPEGVITLTAQSEGTNQSPSLVDIENKEFLSISNNKLGNTWNASWAPAWYNVLERQWKTQETWDLWSVYLDFNVENLDFNIPDPSLWINYYFLFDSNNNGSLSDESPLIMTDQWWNIWRISWINLWHNQIFTIASQASSNNIPTDISLSNTSIYENSGENFSIWTFSSVDLDPSDTHSYSLISGSGDADNAYFSISWNTLQILHSADYEIKNSYTIRIQTDDGNGGIFQKNFTISIHNLWESVSTSIDFESPLDSYKYQIASGDWSRTTTKPYAGTHSFESNNGWVNNTQSCFEVIHRSLSDETMSFYYDVSSQAGSDYLRFYIDDIEQSSWNGTVPWAQYTSPTISAGIHEYKWCYIKDGSWSAGTDNAFIDNIEFAGGSSDLILPVISATNFASGFLLPGGWHTLSISYSDADSWINTSSDTIILNKWNGVSWWGDIAASGLVLWSKTVTATGASYPMNNLWYWKYRYTFSISDNSSNTASETIEFYIDNPEINVSTPEINLWNIDADSSSFSSDIIVTVRTVGAPFRVFLDRNGELQSGSNIIQNFDGSTWYGFDLTPYSGNISNIWISEMLASESGSININWQYNTYNYNLKIWALIGEEQVAWDYEWYLNFGLQLDY